MVRATLLEVMYINKGRYFKLQERGTTKIGTYSEKDVYNALINNKIQIAGLTAGSRLNTVVIDTQFLIKQIHNSNSNSIAEHKSKAVKKKPKQPKKNTNPRLEKYDSELHEIDKIIRRKSISRGIKYKEIERTDDPDVVYELQKSIDSIDNRIYELQERQIEIGHARQKECELIQQEKKDVQKAKTKKTREISKCKRIISLSESNGGLDYYIQTEHRLESEIKSLEEDKQKVNSKYKQDKIFKQINSLNKQLRNIRGSRRTIEEAIAKLRAYEIELGDNNGKSEAT